MIIPMVFMQLGIAMDYWGDFLDNAWSIHIRSGTVWYFYSIIQLTMLPKKNLKSIIGMFIAIGICLTAFSMMHPDLETVPRATEFPNRFGLIQTLFFLWSSCHQNSPDSRLWLCYHQGHHQKKTSG